MQLPFITLDVFTQTRFRGNPLAIVTIPPSSSSSSSSSPITPSIKQAIAREFNLSETVFIHDVPHPSPSRTIDIFLTHAEIPLAGHPIIGAAVSLLPQGVSRIITKSGPIEISPAGPNSARARVPHDIHVHARRLADVPPLPSSPITPSTSPASSSIASLELAAPIVSFVKGVAFILIQLPSLPLLAEIRPGGPPLPLENLLDQGWDHGSLGRYYYVRTGNGPDGEVCIRSRMVLTTLEDPATGSAACCLAGYLSIQQNQPDASHHYKITQGVEMDQESQISVHVQVKDSLIQSVTLAGSAVHVMSGTITV